MGRPSWSERTCPKKDPWCGGNFERLYVRRDKKMIPVGRMCAKCGHIVLDQE